MTALGTVGTGEVGTRLQGQDSRNRNKSAGTGQLEQNSWDRTAGRGQPGRKSRGWSVWTCQPKQAIGDKSAWTTWPRQVQPAQLTGHLGRSARTGHRDRTV
jgi:hypothetical protein